MINYDELQKDLAAVINKHSGENESNTPDHIIAVYLVDCFIAYNRATNARELWYGRNPVKNKGDRNIIVVRDSPDIEVTVIDNSKGIFRQRCRVCGQIFDNPSDLYNHYNTEHDNNTTNER